MKGPFERLKYDLRRQWECPVCHRKERSSYTKTYSFCTCKTEETGNPVAMRLIDDGVRRVWGEAPKKCERVAEEEAPPALPPPESPAVVPVEQTQPVPIPTEPSTDA